MNWQNKFNHFTSFLRKLPDFLVIGTQKGGTTSLFHYLDQHPQLHGSFRKEIHYFTMAADRSPFWYRSFFPWALDRRMVFEATPAYLFDPKVPSLVKKTLPQSKMIVLLRHPIERAISHYHMNVKHGFEHRSLEEAIETELEKLDFYHSQFELTSDILNSSYLGRGLYYHQLSNWLKHVDRSQFLVLCSKQFFSRTQDTLQLIFQFLDIDLINIPNLQVKYQGSYDLGEIPFHKQVVQFFLADHQALIKEWPIDYEL